MPNATRGLLRYWRGALLGLLVGVTTVLGHVAGHGAVEPVPALTVLGLSFAIAGALTGHRLRPATLLPFVVGFQVASHWALSRAPVQPTGRSLGHSHTSVSLGAVGRGQSAHLMPDLHSDPVANWFPQLDASMLGGHTIASLVIIFLVWRTDDAIFAFVTALRRAIDVVLGGGSRVAPHPVTRLVGPPIVRHAQSPSRELSHPSPRQHRGPPVAALPC